jgi:hypothetical protein
VHAAGCKCERRADSRGGVQLQVAGLGTTEASSGVQLCAACRCSRVLMPVRACRSVCRRDECMRAAVVAAWERWQQHASASARAVCCVQVWVLACKCECGCGASVWGACGRAGGRRCVSKHWQWCACVRAGVQAAAVACGVSVRCM